MTQQEVMTVQLGAEIDRIKEYKPSLAGVLDTFGSLLLARATLREELLSAGPRDFEPDMERLTAGVPLLADHEIGKLFPDMDKGLARMLDALGRSFPNLAHEVAVLRDFVIANPSAPAAWLDAVVSGGAVMFGDLAQGLGIEPETARFLIEQGLKPYFEALSATLARHVEKIRWDKGYCPVCGAYPDASYLKKGKEDFEYLVAHGGQRWMHCSNCSYEWRLRRMTCPYCGNEEADSLSYLQAENMAHERIYSCDKCKRYVTCVDISELVDAPPSELLPFTLLHMDLIAQQKGFQPMAWNFWNTIDD